MDGLAQLLSDLLSYAAQATRVAGEVLDDLAQAQIFLAQLGDLYTFIRDTVQSSVAELPRLHEAFARIL